MLFLFHKKQILLSRLTTGILAAALFMTGCKPNKAKQQMAQDANTDTTAPEDVFLPRKGSLSDTLAIPGELIAFQRVDIYAKINSFVRSVRVDVGSEVHAGQLLATMEAPEITSQLSGAYSRLQSQQSTYLASRAYYNRLLETSKTPGTVSGNDLEQAMAKRNSDYAQLLAARAAYNEIAVNRSYLTIRAPFDGVISSRNINPGAYVGPSGSGDALPMMTLQQQRHLRLVVSVPESYTNLLHKGDPVHFTTSSMPNRVFTAKVTRLAGALDTKLRSERTEMDVYSDNHTLLPGMTVEVQLPLPSAGTAYIVPKSAVVNSTEGVYIIAVVNKKYHHIPVSTGQSNSDNVQVFGAIQDNDLIVLNGSEEKREGQAAGKIRKS